MNDLRKKDFIKPKERLRFEDEKRIDWTEVIKGGLLIILMVGLLILCYAPFMR